MSAGGPCYDGVRKFRHPKGPPVTTATAPAKTASAEENALAAWLGRHRFALRRFHSLTGILFGGYVVVHLLVNATLLEGLRYGSEDIYQLQVDKIHILPFLPAVEWGVLLLPIIYHTIYGILVIAAGRPNVGSYGYAKNWAYLFQRISAIVLVFFILFHYLSFKGAFPGVFGDKLTFVPWQATQTTVNHMHAAWWVGWVIYPLGITAATYHTANGFWTGAVTWGVTVGAKAQQLWFYACIGLFFFMTACGLAALGASLADKPTDGPTPQQQGIENRVGQKGVGDISNMTPASPVREQ